MREKWFEDFEYEFQKQLPASKRVAGSKLKPWGREVKHRPKKLNLLTKEQAREKGYMVIRFWKDRTVEDDSEVMAGTYTELRQQLLDRMRTVDANVQVYGIPTTTYQEEVKFAPQVMLFFIEDPEDVEPNWSPVDGRLSFRVIGETSSTINEAKATVLANKIKQLFASDNGYVWRKGKSRISYTDKKNGYSNWINCRTEADGEKLIKQALAVQNIPFSRKNMHIINSVAPEEEAPTIPDKIIIYGEETYEPRKRPIADVRFVRAELHFWGRPKPVVLIDRVNFGTKALVSA